MHVVGADLGSTAAKADAGYHRSDAITSDAAFVGIPVVLVGRRVLHGGVPWAAADNWAALPASAVIAYTGAHLLQPALDDLMDRTPGEDVLGPMRHGAASLPDVRAVETLHAREVGLGYRVAVHVHATRCCPSSRRTRSADGRAKAAIQHANSKAASALVHREPDPADVVTVARIALPRVRVRPSRLQQ